MRFPMQDFGARDPFPGELATNFSEKSLGHENTEHMIKWDGSMGMVVLVGAGTTVV